MNISGRRLGQFTPQARQVIVQTLKQMMPYEVTPRHILAGLLENGDEGIWLESLESIGVELGTVIDRLQSSRWLDFRGSVRSNRLSGGAEKVINLSLQEAARLGQSYAGCEALLLGLISQGDRRAGQVLIGLGADLQRTRREVERLLQQRIGSFTRNLTKAAIDGELAPVIGREREIERILHILFRDPMSVPVLVGEPGIGKTSVVFGLAQRIAANKVPETFANTQVAQLDLDAVSQTLGSEALDELISQTLAQRDVLVFIDDQLLGIEVLRHDDARIIGAMTPRHYSHADHDLPRRLVPVTLDEVSAEQTVQILEGLLRRGEKRHPIDVTSGAIGAAAWHGRERLKAPVPGSALKLLDEAVSLGELRGLDSIDEKTVAEAVAGMLGVAPDQIEEAPRVQTPVIARVEHDKEIWEMS